MGTDYRMRSGFSIVDGGCLLVVWHVTHLHSLLFRSLSSVERVSLANLMCNSQQHVLHA